MPDETKKAVLVRYEETSNCSVCMEDDGPLFVEVERRDATHIALPLDVSQIDDAAIEVMAKAACNIAADDGSYHPAWAHTSEVLRDTYRTEARAALSALLAHYAKVK